MYFVPGKRQYAPVRLSYIVAYDCIIYTSCCKRHVVQHLLGWAWNEGNPTLSAKATIWLAMALFDTFGTRRGRIGTRNRNVFGNMQMYIGFTALNVSAVTNQ